MSFDIQSGSQHISITPLKHGWHLACSDGPKSSHFFQFTNAEAFWSLVDEWLAGLTLKPGREERHVLLKSRTGEDAGRIDLIATSTGWTYKASISTKEFFAVLTPTDETFWSEAVDFLRKWGLPEDKIAALRFWKELK